MFRGRFQSTRSHVIYNNKNTSGNDYLGIENIIGRIKSQISYDIASYFHYIIRSHKIINVSETLFVYITLSYDSHELTSINTASSNKLHT